MGPFMEDELFSDITKEPIRKQFIQYFHNISNIMDCVSCEKCRMYGKLQVYGIGTAMKILFGSSPDQRNKFELKRNEIISLINTLAKYSETLRIIDRFYVRRSDQYLSRYFAVFCACGFLFIFLCTMHKIYEIMPAKVKKMFRHSGVKFIGKK